MVCEKDVPCSERLKQRRLLTFLGAAPANVEVESPAVKAWVRTAVQNGDAPHVDIDDAEAERVRSARTARDHKQGKVFEPVATGGDAPRTPANDAAVRKWEHQAHKYGIAEQRGAAA
jgi:hypothetical protein